MPTSNDSSLWRFFGLGIELAGAVAVLTFLGYLVDRWLASAPWGLVTGAMLGIVGGLYNIVKTALKANRDERQRDDEGTVNR